MTRKAVSHLSAVAAVLSAIAVAAQIAPALSREAFVPSSAAATRPFTQLIVKYRDETASSHRSALASNRITALSARAGQTLTYKRPMSGLAHVLYLPRAMTEAEARAIASRLRQDPSVEYAVPDYVRRPLAAPNDPGYATGFTWGDKASLATSGMEGQWNLYAPTDSYTYRVYGASATTTVNPAGGANVPNAWALSTGAGVVVAIVDTGVVSHPDLNADLVNGVPASSGYDFISGNAYDGTTDPNASNPYFTANDGNGRDPDPSDPGDWINTGDCGTLNGKPDPAQNQDSTWHGTHISGIIAAVTNNGTGVAGMAYGAKILMARALGRCGGTDSDIIDAMRWSAGISVPNAPANANPARVINLSLGGSTASGPDTCTAAQQSAINDVRARGAVVIAAAGNDGMPNIASPASCAGVIAVTAHTLEGDLADYANYGDSGDGSATKAATNATTISAPGGGCGIATRSACSDNYIWSTINRGTTAPDATASGPTYGGYAGSSMATAHVAAAAALLFAMDQALTPDRVQSLLTSSARSFPANTYCATGGSGAGKCGAGLLDVAAAVKQLSAAQQPSSGGGGGGAIGWLELLLLAVAAMFATFKLRRNRARG